MPGASDCRGGRPGPTIPLVQLGRKRLQRLAAFVNSMLSLTPSTPDKSQGPLPLPPLSESLSGRPSAGWSVPIPERFRKEEYVTMT